MQNNESILELPVNVRPVPKAQTIQIKAFKELKKEEIKSRDLFFISPDGAKLPTHPLI